MLRRDRRASGTLEFALVALPFVMSLLFLLELGYDFFAQVALDYGVLSIPSFCSLAGVGIIESPAASGFPKRLGWAPMTQ